MPAESFSRLSFFLSFRDGAVPLTRRKGQVVPIFFVFTFRELKYLSDRLFG
jgi:hypothetical protein